jgi:hypothetical protein
MLKRLCTEHRKPIGTYFEDVARIPGLRRCGNVFAELIPIQPCEERASGMSHLTDQPLAVAKRE